jgi:hypothetical protein
VKPTAYLLIVMGLLLAGSGVLLGPTADPSTTAEDGRSALLGRSPGLTVALFVAAGLAVAAAAAMLRYGGKGYTETNVSPAGGRSRPPRP